jgi:hypothetical protein
MRRTIMTAAALALLTTTAHAASQAEEDFAAKGAAVLLLTASKCDLGTVDIERIMNQTDAVYDTAGVHPTDYKPGEWLRKTYFIINQTDFLRAIEAGDRQMVRAFCASMAEKFPNKH